MNIWELTKDEFFSNQVARDKVQKVYGNNDYLAYACMLQDAWDLGKEIPEKVRSQADMQDIFKTKPFGRLRR